MVYDYVIRWLKVLSHIYDLYSRGIIGVIIHGHVIIGVIGHGHVINIYIWCFGDI